MRPEMSLEHFRKKIKGRYTGIYWNTSINCGRHYFMSTREAGIEAYLLNYYRTEPTVDPRVEGRHGRFWILTSYGFRGRLLG
jgi:hypothetical protein